MAKQRRTTRTANQPGRLGKKLEAFGRKWEKTMAASVKGAQAHMNLAKELYELAIGAEDGELKIVEHRFEKAGSKPKAHVTSYRLTDPRAALHAMFRFCNVLLPMGQWICLMRGCPAWAPPGAPAGKFCFLVGCFVNVCPAAGAPKTLCVYLCI